MDERLFQLASMTCEHVQFRIARSGNGGQALSQKLTAGKLCARQGGESFLPRGLPFVLLHMPIGLPITKEDSPDVRECDGSQDGSSRSADMIPWVARQNLHASEFVSHLHYRLAERYNTTCKHTFQACLGCTTSIPCTSMHHDNMHRHAHTTHDRHDASNTDNAPYPSTVSCR